MTSARAIRSALILLMIAAACSGKTTPSASNSSLSPTPTPTPSPCVGKIVPITFECPLSEVGNKDVSSQGQDVKVTIQAGEGAWEPTYIKAKPGAHVTLSIEADFAVHSFTVDSLGLNEQIPPSKTTIVSFTLPATGPMIFYCVPHRARGMQGAFYFS